MADMKCSCCERGLKNNFSCCAAMFGLEAALSKARAALENIVLILGPTIPDCCEGAQTEMAGALKLASEALKESE